MGESFEQLDELLVTLGASEGWVMTSSIRRPDTIVCRVTVARATAPVR